jgi:hypothetical protein
MDSSGIVKGGARGKCFRGENEQVARESLTRSMAYLESNRKNPAHENEVA